MKNKNILITLTTTGGGWENKLADIERFNITEISLFPTVLEKNERKKLYAALEKSSIKSIPHVHIKNDMTLDELDFFVKRFKTKVFNNHPEKFYPQMYDLSKYAKQIFVENTGTIPTEKEIQRCGGICIDFSHLDSLLKTNDDPDYDKFLTHIEKYKIGCCHVSAIMEKPWLDINDPGTPGRQAYDTHKMSKLSDLDYMKKYKKYLPEYISLELENSIAEQIKAKKYLEKILDI